VRKKLNEIEKNLKKGSEFKERCFSQIV